MTAPGLWTLFACGLLLYLQAVLLLMGGRLQTIVALLGVLPMLALLVFAHVRFIAPLAQARREARALAEGSPAGAARPLFGRADEIGRISQALAALQSAQLERDSMQAEVRALQDRVDRAEQGREARDGFVDALRAAIATPPVEEPAALEDVARIAAMLAQSPLDEEQKCIVGEIAARAAAVSSLVSLGRPT